MNFHAQRNCYRKTDRNVVGCWFTVITWKFSDLPVELVICTNYKPAFPVSVRLSLHLYSEMISILFSDMFKPVCLQRRLHSPFRASVCGFLGILKLLPSWQSWESEVSPLITYFQLWENRKHPNKPVFSLLLCIFLLCSCQAARLYQSVCCVCIMGGTHLTSALGWAVWCVPWRPAGQRVIDRTVVRRITMPWCRGKLIILTLWLTCNFSAAH